MQDETGMLLSQTEPLRHGIQKSGYRLVLCQYRAKLWTNLEGGRRKEKGKEEIMYGVCRSDIKIQE